MTVRLALPASTVVQMLVPAGPDHVRMHHGSFGEWGRRQGHPIETGDSR